MPLRVVVVVVVYRSGLPKHSDNYKQICMYIYIYSKCITLTTSDINIARWQQLMLRRHAVGSGRQARSERPCSIGMRPGRCTPGCISITITITITYTIIITFYSNISGMRPGRCTPGGERARVRKEPRSICFVGLLCFSILGQNFTGIHRNFIGISLEFHRNCDRISPEYRIGAP